MRDRRVRLAFLGLILAFPLLMTLTGGRALDRETAKAIFAVEAVLTVGLLFAARSRRELLEAPMVPENPIASLAKLHAPRPATRLPLVAGVRRR